MVKVGRQRHMLLNCAVYCFIEGVEENAPTWPVATRDLSRRYLCPTPSQTHTGQVCLLRCWLRTSTASAGGKGTEDKSRYLWGKSLSLVQTGKPSTPLARTGPFGDGHLQPGTDDDVRWLPPEGKKRGQYSWFSDLRDRSGHLSSILACTAAWYLSILMDKKHTSCLL